MQHSRILSSTERAFPGGREKGKLPLPIRFAGVQLARFVLTTWKSEGYFLDTQQEAGDPGIPSHLNGDCVFFHSVPTETMPALSARQGHLFYVLKRYPRYVLDLSLSADELLADWNSKSRSTLKRKIKGVEKLSGGTPDIMSARTPEELSAFLEEALPLSQKTYQHRLLKSGLPESAAFRNQMLKLAAQNAVRAWLLRLDGKAVAYLLCPAKDGVLFYDYVGYDPTYGQHSVGLVLQWLALSELMEEKAFRLFDFTPGEGQHKAKFASQKYDCMDLLVVPLFSASALKAALHCMVTWLDNRLAALADAVGLKARLKKLLRRG